MNEKPAHAADVGISVRITEPGVFARHDFRHEHRRD
jgi:hypothetical protein